MPEWFTLKLAAYGIAGLALIGAVIFVVQTVNGWRHDSLALPQVVAARDQAIAEKRELEKYAVGAFSHIETGIAGLGGKWAAFETSYSGRMSDIDEAIAAFGRKTNHVEACPLPGSPGDQLIRDELRRLIANPDTGAIDRGADGPGARGTGAHMPGAAAPAPALPGRRPAAEDKQGALVPAAGGARHGRRKRAAEKRSRAGDRLGAKGTDRQAEAQRVGRDLPRITVCGSKRIRHSVIAFRAALEELGMKARIKIHG